MTEKAKVIIIIELILVRSTIVPCGKKRKRAKIATHKRKKKLRRNRHKSK